MQNCIASLLKGIRAGGRGPGSSGGASILRRPPLRRHRGAGPAPPNNRGREAAPWSRGAEPAGGAEEPARGRRCGERFRPP